MFCYVPCLLDEQEVWLVVNVNGDLFSRFYINRNEEKKISLAYEIWKVAWQFLKKEYQRLYGLDVYTGFPDGSAIKNPPANAGDTGNSSANPGSGRSSRRGDSNRLQYSCLKNYVDRGAWWAIIHGVPKSRTWLSDRAQMLPNYIINLNYKDVAL